MLKTEFGRHTIAFLTVVLASILLYPFVQAGSIAFAWFLLGTIILAAILTLTTK